MRIVVNGERRETDASTIDELCRAMGFGDLRVATAVNGDFVSRPVRCETRLAEGDRIEILSPRQGG